MGETTPYPQRILPVSSIHVCTTSTHNKESIMKKSLAQAFLDVSLDLPTDDPSVKRRLDRAYDIARLEGYEIEAITEPYAYRVTRLTTSSLEDNSATYIVDSNSCTCPDFDTARGGLCKHRLAIRMWEKMISEEMI